MKVDPASPLRVSFEFVPDHIVAVGRVALDRGLAVLEYSPQFASSQLVLNPLFGPPGTELVRAKEPRVFDGLHGVLADSLPDAWGQALMRRRAAASGIDYSSLTVLDKLAWVGRRGMGALTYEPAFPSSDDDHVDLDVLARESIEVLEGRDSDVLPLLERLGGSSGGARPKVLVAMNSAGTVISGTASVPDRFEPWLVKFRSSRDLVDTGPLEAAYAAMARAAGVAMSESKLIASATGGPGYFATKRFDRAPGGARHHVVSVAGLLDVDWQYPSMDYKSLLALTRMVTRRQPDVDEMFHRMVFNVIAHNRDDHAKQQAFLMDAAGRWSLAPAYDLTFSTGPGGEHYFTVDGAGTNIGPQSISAVAKTQGIDAASVRAVTEQVTGAVSRFNEFAREYGVGRQTTADVRKVLDQQLRAF